MRLFNAHDIVRICEWGQNKHALDRALVLLRAASPDTPPETLSRLPIGRRDLLLLELRALAFGPKLEVAVPCPRCRERLQLDLLVDKLRRRPPEGLGSPLEAGGYVLDYRLPDSLDLAALAHIQDAREARARLLQRCVREVSFQGQPAPLESVPEEVLASLAVRLAEEDPQADITFRLTCPCCAHVWLTAFDILSFFWLELEAYARQLQREVHGLAKAYGWSETAILSLSAPARRRYMELINSG
jgi:hypothetical protein